MVVLITDGKSTNQLQYLSELSQLNAQLDRHVFGIGSQTDSVELLVRMA